MKRGCRGGRGGKIRQRRGDKEGNETLENVQRLKEWSVGGGAASRQQGMICGGMKEKRGRAAGNTKGFQKDFKRMWKNRVTLLKEMQA